MRLKDRKASCKDADSVLLPLDVPPQGLDALVNGLAQTTNCDGLIVTRPHKESILRSCTHLTAAARAVGCCNVVRFHKGAMIGTNMDGDGFVGGLIQQRGANAVRNQRCLLVGAGGAARGRSCFSRTARGRYLWSIERRRELKRWRLASPASERSMHYRLR